MSDAARLISLDAAQAGMALARALTDARGQVLMSAGATLTDTALASLRRRDVSELWVHDGDTADTPDPGLAAAALAAQHQARLERLFRQAGNSPDQHRLLTLMYRYRGVALP